MRPEMPPHSEYQIPCSAHILTIEINSHFSSRIHVQVDFQE
ncbi:hypothetical protein METH_09675 [Leisingera methylohalidivorans DSM 14336]|uniref:Uncharacterized protein n=1 Tax=Leisingera methylohalidivorans DSM 14336 TaxID=999552 RepID=V9VWA6_9RHOB|nr:hypothetical protein METH_09675 [Leisingera methylohalidivorans DSM 14336]